MQTGLDSSIVRGAGTEAPPEIEILKATLVSPFRLSRRMSTRKSLERAAEDIGSPFAACQVRWRIVLT
jgi:hypothetical protein